MSASVVITGVGVVTPLGSSVGSFWNGLLEGRVGTRRARHPDLQWLSCCQAGEIDGFEPHGYFRVASAEAHERATQMAVATARMAADDAGLNVAELGERAGIVVGTVVGNRPGVELAYSRIHGGVEPAHFELSRHDASNLSEAPAIELGARGPVLTIATACAAGNSAIGCATDLIADGHADLVLAGGADELSPAMFAMFARFNALSPDVVRPFDRDRKGLILSEGAAMLVLEDEEHARRRGARPYARVAGHGNFADAHDMTEPHPSGVGARAAMHAALEAAGIAAEDVDWVCAHGTGTPANDRVEAEAIRSVFGKRGDAVPVSSLKSSLGHAQGAASAIEAVACVLALREGVIPPTVNVETLDPRCPIELVRTARKRTLHAVLNNAFGFGGNISCVMFTKP